jgi:hypothetical protein
VITSVPSKKAPPTSRHNPEPAFTTCANDEDGGRASAVGDFEGDELFEGDGDFREGDGDGDGDGEADFDGGGDDVEEVVGSFTALVTATGGTLTPAPAGSPASEPVWATRNSTSGRSATPSAADTRTT